MTLALREQAGGGLSTVQLGMPEWGGGSWGEAGSSRALAGHRSCSVQPGGLGARRMVSTQDWIPEEFSGMRRPGKMVPNL